MTFVAFDVLALDSESVTGRPWEERRRPLEDLGLDAHPRLTTSPWLDGVEPAAALELAEDHGLEGCRPSVTTARVRRSRAGRGRRGEVAPDRNRLPQTAGLGGDGVGAPADGR
ncbi:hypothetical protein [Actinomycetospora aeridis]|uniref:ATP dependent DNA ligase-like protein n=1 Tax=Actinomycetospora aeridis TaxID=3129231 RepID=A0ABU8MYN5_9PSEU